MPKLSESLSGPLKQVGTTSLLVTFVFLPFMKCARLRMSLATPTDAGPGAAHRQGVAGGQTGGARRGRLRRAVQAVHDGRRGRLVPRRHLRRDLQNDRHLRRQHHPLHAAAGGAAAPDGPGLQEHRQHGAGEQIQRGHQTHQARHHFRRQSLLVAPSCLHLLRCFGCLFFCSGKRRFEKFPFGAPLFPLAFPIWKIRIGRLAAGKKKRIRRQTETLAAHCVKLASALLYFANRKQPRPINGWTEMDRHLFEENL